MKRENSGVDSSSTPSNSEVPGQSENRGSSTSNCTNSSSPDLDPRAPELTRRKQLREWTEEASVEEILSYVRESTPPTLAADGLQDEYVCFVLGCIEHNADGVLDPSKMTEPGKDDLPGVEDAFEVEKWTEVEKIEEHIDDDVLDDLPATTKVPDVNGVLEVEHVVKYSPRHGEPRSRGVRVSLGAAARALAEVSPEYRQRCVQRVLGISYGNSPEEGEENPRSAAANADSGADSAMWKSHVGGYLREKVPVPKTVLNEFERMLDQVDLAEEYAEYSAVLRRMIAHVYYCQTRRPYQHANGVPIGHKLLKKACDEDDEATVPTRTKDVWTAAEDVLLDVENYIYREDGVGRSRRFKIPERALRRLDEARSDGYQYSTRYDLVDGKRLYSGFQTQTTYDGDHSWKERSKFIYETLKRLKGQRDLVNPEAVEKHLDRLQEEFNETDAAYREAVGALEGLKNEILEEGKSLTPHEKERLSQARERAYEAGRELERVRSRRRQDERIWSDIVAQGLENAEDQPEGIYKYETAYEVQEVSGRLTMTCGLQNASSEMKAAAAKGVEGIKDMDIKSSQTNKLIEEMEMAVQMGADLNVSILIDYVEEGGKDRLAEQFGIDREEWKRPEHSVKFGAGFNHDTYEDARSSAKQKVIARIGTDEDGRPKFENLDYFSVEGEESYESGENAWERAVYNELPTMAAVARDWADDEDIDYDDPEEIYSILEDAYGEMADEIDAWRDWLISEFWEENKQSGGYGAFVRNPCDIPFSIHDPRLAESGDEPSEYDQKTGFATSRLQGGEAAFMHVLTQIQDNFNYEVLRNEHDGAFITGEIPDEAVEKAREKSGFHSAELESKSFEDTDQCDTKTSKDQSTQSPQEKPSKSPTSPSGATSGGGSADGAAGQGGANVEKTRSGSARPSPVPSGSTSDTTCRDTAASDSSTGSPATTGSKRSSEKTTGSTSPDQNDREWPKTGDWDGTLDLGSIGEQPERGPHPAAGPPESAYVEENKPAVPPPSARGGPRNIEDQAPGNPGPTGPPNIEEDKPARPPGEAFGPPDVEEDPSGGPPVEKLRSRARGAE